MFSTAIPFKIKRGSAMTLKTVVLMACVGMQAFAAKAEFREFTDTQGRTLTAELISYNALQEQVTIKLKGKGNKTVPVNIFSETDRKYIVSWKQNQDFLKSNKLVVSFNRCKKKNTDNSSSSMGFIRKYYDHSFSIKIENRSPVDFNDIEFEYVIFYSQERHIKDWTDTKEEHGTLYARKAISLPKKSTREIETEKLLLINVSSEPRHSVISVSPDLKGRVNGIILNLSMKTETSETISRQIKFPENLNHVWTPRTKDVQIPPAE